MSVPISSVYDTINTFYVYVEVYISVEGGQGIHVM